jgi:hypothetical protein
MARSPSFGSDLIAGPRYVGIAPPIVVRRRRSSGSTSAQSGKVRPSAGDDGGYGNTLIAEVI